MYKNYLTTALRNLLKHKLHAALNIAGLAAGLVVSILILLFIQDELSFDRFWKDADQIYRLHTTFKSPGRSPSSSVQAQGPSKEAIKRHFPHDIEYSTRFTEMSGIVQSGSKIFNESIYLTDAETADIFSLAMVEGSLAAALKDTKSLAVSESFARKYFGDEEAVGKILTLSIRQLKHDYQIAAVFKDLPHNTVLSFQVLTLLDETAFPSRFDSWTSFSGPVFFKLNDGSSIEKINAELDNFIRNNINLPEYAANGGAVTDYIEYSAVALPDLQLSASGWGEMKETGDVITVIVFGVIAALILLIASINFMNLMTVQSTLRAKEISVRKVLGARRYQLAVQFLSESILITFVSLLLGLAVIELVLPYYTSFLGRELALDLSDSFIFLALMGLTLTVGLIGGLYPALKLSGSLPIKTLTGEKLTNFGGFSILHNVLVILQFTISIALMVATAVIYKQMSHMSNMDLGYRLENLLVLKGVRSEGAKANQQALKEELMKRPNVLNVAYSWGVPGIGGIGTVSVEIPGQSNLGAVQLAVLGRDENFLDTYEISLLAGRNYNPKLETDGIPDSRDAEAGALLRGTVIVNETAVKRLGFGTAEKALGKIIRTIVEETPEGPVKADMEIIGVVPDIHLRSLRNEVPPEMHELVKEGAPLLTIRFVGDPKVIVEDTEKIWRQLNPTVSFDYEFAGEALDITLEEEKKSETMLTTFATLSIVIACLGLYSLSGFSAESRAKEIGVRKVFGASVWDIVQHFVWRFSIPVFIANLTAWPTAYYFVRGWLDGFAYPIDLTVWYFVAAGAFTLLIAWATVSLHAVRAARSNPIKALRHE